MTSTAAALEIAPEFPPGIEWLNLSDAMHMADLRGRVCALGFVNVGSAWSLQRLRDLAQLQLRHGDRLQAVAMHVPRFDYERDGRRVASCLHQHGIGFPVAHDPDWIAWQHYDIDAWPTVVLIDGEGRIRERIVGDGPTRELDRRTMALCEAQVSVDGTVAFQLRRQEEPAMPLRFPVGLAVDEQYLYVADSGHHRVLECDHGGRILRQFGCADPGFIDGPAELAAFSHPHALCLQRGRLYVVDSGNHAVRTIDLRSGGIDTLCGAGRPGMPVAGIVRNPRDVAFDQPSAVALVGDALLIACRGDNRIWKYDLGKDELALLAGSGSLAIEDEAGEAAAFAEPVALATVQQRVYICDGAGSAIRTMNIRSKLVKTLIGQGPWHYGCTDGVRSDASLQAPQAIALDPDAPVLWIADCGNNQLRTLRLGGGELSTVALPQKLHGPRGLAVGHGAVWIADTDAHAVLRLDVASGTLQHVPIGE